MANSPPQQVESLSAIASGLEFSDEGSLVAVNEEHRSKLTKQLKDLAQGAGPSARFIRWFFSTGSDRTIFPASGVKIAEWVDNALLTNSNVTEEWIRNALIFLPNHPLLHIALAGFETDSKRADFLRSFGLARLPKSSAVCRRAGEMLLAQHQPRLALAAVDNALLADPTDQTAQRLRLEVLVVPAQWPSAVSSAKAKVSGHWPLPSWQTGHFVSAIWKFLLAFALTRCPNAEAVDPECGEPGTAPGIRAAGSTHLSGLWHYRASGHIRVAGFIGC